MWSLSKTLYPDCSRSLNCEMSTDIAGDSGENLVPHPLVRFLVPMQQHQEPMRSCWRVCVCVCVCVCYA